MKTQAHADNRIQLWLAPVPATFAPAQSMAFEALLSEDERVRWQRFHRADDRQRFLLGRAFMRMVLSESLGHCDPATLQFTRLLHGKPELGGIHAGRLQFNLSHTHDMLVLAVSRVHAVGIDVEAATRKVELHALARRYFARHEYEELLALAPADQRERFFRLWTLKEAWLKARGLGLRIPLDEFSFEFTGQHPAVQFGPQLDESADQWQFRTFTSEQFRIALAVHCAAAVPLHVQTHEWRPPCAS